MYVNKLNYTLLLMFHFNFITIKYKTLLCFIHVFYVYTFRPILLYSYDCNTMLYNLY